MKTLYALLVAINDYPAHKLDGCIHDVQEAKAYLAAHCQAAGCAFQPLELIDEQATRDNLIKGFEHFGQAEKGDACLFFFAGHGSCCEAPEAFRHLAPGGMIESMVCWDSRRPGGRDLMDKELSFLIWQATEGREVHFLAITDCCHSGNITRGVKERLIREAGPAALPEQYLGFEHYKPAGEGRYSPPRGRYVHLSAARDSETAKEVFYKGAPRGVFSYCLLEALQQTNGQLSYAELASRVNLRVKAIVRDQSAQLDAAVEADKKQLFLSGAIAGGAPAYLISYDKKLGWILNAGAIHGIREGDESFRTVFRLKDAGHRIRVAKVLANCSQVEGAEGLDKERQYAAIPEQLASPGLNLAFAEDGEPEGAKLLRELMQQKGSGIFTVVSDKSQADYLIHARDGAYFLSVPFDEGKLPLFQKVQGYSLASATDFLNRLETVARWRQLLQLSNPASSIREEEVDIALFRATDAGNYEDDAPAELLDWRGANDFEYRQGGGEWHRPAFQFKVKNTGRRSLWVSLLYLSADFGITNQLLPKQALEPGQEAWAFDLYDGHPYRTISLEVDDHQGGSTIEEYFKLIICTDEFDTFPLNQDGLEPERLLHPTRKVGFRRPAVERPDWAAKEMCLRIRRPK